jgi:hypothetical protein
MVRSPGYSTGTATRLQNRCDACPLDPSTAVIIFLNYADATGAVHCPQKKLGAPLRKFLPSA